MAKETVKELKTTIEALKTEIAAMRKLLMHMNEEHEREMSRTYAQAFAEGSYEGIEEADAAYKAQGFIDRLLKREPLI